MVGKNTGLTLEMRVTWHVCNCVSLDHLHTTGRRAAEEDSLAEVTRLLCECIGTILKCKSTTVNDFALQEILKSLQFMQSTSTAQVSVYLCYFFFVFPSAIMASGKCVNMSE